MKSKVITAILALATLNCWAGKVTLPDWFYHLTIDELTITGYMSDEVKAEILKHFPNAQVR